jgi:ATP-binding cassette subfamily C protein CydC
VTVLDHPGGHGVIAPVRTVLGVLGRLRWWIVAAALLSGATMGAGIGLLSLAGYLISRSELVDSTATLTLAIVGVRFFAVLRATGRYGERYVGHLGTFRILTRLRVWLYGGIEPLAPAGLIDDRSGDVLTRLVDDVETLQDVPLRVVAPRGAAVIAGVVGALVLVWLGPMLAATLVGFLVVVGVVVPATTRALTRSPGADLVALRAESNAVAVEGVSAIDDLVAYGREDLFTGRLAELTAASRSAERRLAWARGLTSAAAATLAGLAIVSITILASGLVDDGRLDGVFLAVAPLAVIATLEAVAPLAASFEHVDRTTASARRLVEVVERTPAVVDPASPGELPAGAGAIRFDGVTFAYLPGAPPALRDATFAIPSGARVGIVGPSGAGKSTIASLLLRFWEPQTGVIGLDGLDVRTFPAAVARANVSVVAQRDHLFDTTIRDNLLLADADATDAHLLEACDAVALGGLVADIDGGLEARIGENGNRLSGGQRQQLMIARALLAEAPVLVLDEACVHLDQVTAAELLAGVERWRAGRTTVHIAHDLAHLGPLDVVFDVADGRVERR